MGRLGEDALISILRVLLKNCLLAETTDRRTGSELREAVRGIADQNAQKRISALLEKILEQSRFVAILEVEDEDDTVPTSVIALRNRDHTYLDAIITEASAPFPAGRTEVISAESFHGSDFAGKCQQANDGFTLAKGKIQPREFFSKHFARLLIVKGPVEIYDRVIGKVFGTYFGGKPEQNFKYNLPWWVDFLKQADHSIQLIIHTEGGQTQSIQDSLMELCSNTRISPKVICHPPHRLPHERYLKTPAFILNLGRGIDLFDPYTRQNRDLHIAFSPGVALPK